MTDSSTQQKPAEAPLRVAMVGCGYWGRNLVRNFAGLGALVAVSDHDPATAEKYAGEFGVPAMDFPSILADPSIDAIGLATPAERHFVMAGQALEAGKDVFVEKPLALTATDADILHRQAVAAGRVLMVGHLLQYHPVFLRLKQLVHDGALGRLQYIYSNRLNLGKIRREENILWSFAPHDISMILGLVGEEPETVLASGANYLHHRIADVTTTHLRFPGGVNAHIFVSWLHPFKEQKLVVVGEKQMAVFDDGLPWDSKLTLYPHQIEWREGRPEPKKAAAEPVPLDPDEPLKLECRHFLDCVASQSTPRTDGAEAVRVLRVLQSAEASMAAGQPVSLAVEQGETEPPRANPGRADVFVHESAYVDEPVEIGAGTKIWHFSHVLSGSRIGAECSIGQNASIGPDVTIGDRCKIQNNVSLYKGVTLEDGVFCGPSCVFTNVHTPRAEVDRRGEFLPTRVGRGATIGANATIVCGNDIGDHCLIAAGAVVTRDVPSHALMAGVPARRIGWVGHAGERLDAKLTCPRTGRRYREAGPDRLEEVTDD